MNMPKRLDCHCCNDCWCKLSGAATRLAVVSRKAAMQELNLKFIRLYLIEYTLPNVVANRLASPFAERYLTAMEQPRLNAIYQARRKPYEFDTCEPQVRAVKEGKNKLHALSK